MKNPLPYLLDADADITFQCATPCREYNTTCDGQHAAALTHVTLQYAPVPFSDHPRVPEPVPTGASAAWLAAGRADGSTAAHVCLGTAIRRRTHKLTARPRQ
jgi:hypothetical protein